MTLQLVRYSPEGPVNGGDPDTVNLTEYDVLPRTLKTTLARADRVEIDDPLSFPFEDAGPELWDLPLLVRLPDLTFDDCLDLFDRLLLQRLTVCDQLAAPDSLVAPLMRHYGFNRSMFVGPDHEPMAGDLEAVARIDGDLGASRSPRKSEPSLPTVASKRPLVRLDRAVRKAVAGAAATGGGMPSIELHGWDVRRLIPAVWNDLIRVVERRPSALERLGFEYPLPGFELDGPGSPVRPRATDVGVGVDHLRQSSHHAIEQSLSLLFASVQVGGRLVLLETFDGDPGPHGFVDLLLEVSTHRLILQELMIVTGDDDVSTTALFVLNKIGSWVRP